MSEYRVQLRRGVYHAVRTVNGQTVPVSLRTTDLGEAKRRLIDWLAVKPGDTVADLIAVYLADKDQTAIRANDLHWSWKQAKDHFGHLRPDQITRNVCRDYTAARTAAGLGPNSIRKELETVRAAVNFNKQGASAVWELPAKPPGRERYLSRDEARRLIKSARHAPHIRAFIVLSLCTAARSGALLELTWDRVDLDRRQASLKVGDNLDDQRKNRARVPLNKRACRYLRVMREASTTPYVIEWSGDRVRSIKKGFGTAVRKAQLEDVTPHTLRHTAASWMAEANVPIFEISKLLGHGDTRITERTYAHMRPDFLRSAAKALEW